MIADVSKVSYSTGYGEGGPSFKGLTVRKVEDVDLYDMSQGIPQDLISLYGRYAGTAIRDDYMPQVEAATVTNGLNWIMSSILALGGDVSEAQMTARLDAVAAKVSLSMSDADVKEIAEKKYKLTPGLYAGGKVQEEDAEPFDAKMKRLGADLDALFTESARLEKLVRQNLAAIGYGL